MSANNLTRNVPLSSLAPTGGDVTVINTEPRRTGNFTNLILWFILIFLAAYALLYATKPSWVQRTDALTGRPNGERDQGKLIFWSLILALVITLIIYIVYSRR